ncbi:uncharacterized protein LOC131230245 [Magnolia sinica]|uniref:uncharacterized protein LOC131230245 n=1 Tax=Magnolia sinica TaxID=86752 RepID=UPI00265B619A|nr:uncharacterized protein LOC131230245 [Magnolia sinica]
MKLNSLDRARTITSSFSLYADKASNACKSLLRTPIYRISSEINATQGENATQVKSTCSSPFPIIKIPLQMDKEPQDNVLEPVITHPNTGSMEKGGGKEDDDDWDAFQSFPADNACTAAHLELVRTEVVLASNDDSPILQKPTTKAKMTLRRVWILNCTRK